VSSVGRLGWVLKVAFASLFARRQVVILAAHQTQQDLAVLKSLIEPGKVKPVIEKPYSLAEVSSALWYQGQGHAKGKSVITVTG
jgi:D-arabinose 1-dehydrogenase-like Zn-dependent alcohol dehydrogenase